MYYSFFLIVHILITTKSPHRVRFAKVFFERYNFLIQETENLAELEVFLNFKGKKPSDTVKYLNQVREKETNTMIRRVWEEFHIKFSRLKTNKGKENATNRLFEEFKPFFNEMTQSNIDLCTSYYNTFISNI